MIKRIAVMGCGSLGLILGAYLTRAGLDVTMVDAWQEHVDAMNTKGARVVDGVEMTVPVHAIVPDQMEGTYDLFLYLAKQTFNETAIPQMVAHCHEDTIICTCQNGLPEVEVAKYWPAEKVMGATVGWPATLLGPGVSRLTTKPTDEAFCFHLGRLKGEVDEKVYEVQAILDKMTTGRTYITEHLIQDRWSKIVINATISGMSTVAANTFGFVTTDPEASICVARIGREVVRTCHAMGFNLPKIYNIDFDKVYDFNDEAGQEQAIQVMRTLSGTSEGKASMLQDFERGKRKVEIQAINGALCRAGREYGIPTPYSDAVVRIVEEIEQGKRPLRNNVFDMPKLPI